MKHFLPAFGEHHVLHHLEILGDSRLVSVYAALQLHDSADGLAAAVLHLERSRHLAHLHCVYHMDYFGRQILHSET